MRDYDAIAIEYLTYIYKPSGCVKVSQMAPEAWFSATRSCPKSLLELKHIDHLWTPTYLVNTVLIIQAKKKKKTSSKVAVLEAVT